MLRSQVTNRLFEQVLMKSSLCDIRLLCEDGIVTAHKSVLCAASHVFEAMLTSNFIEAKSSEVKIDLTSEITERILEFLYTDKFTATAETVWEILDFAHQYQLEDLITACSQFISGQTEEDSPPGIQEYRYGLIYDNDKLIDIGVRRMSDDIAGTLKLQEFGELEYEQLIRFILHNHGKHAENLEAIIGWIKYDSEKRYDEYYRNSLDFVHLNRISDDRFSEFVHHPFYVERQKDWDLLGQRREHYARKQRV